ncbi:MAG TPA: hypothetical protein DCZ92_01250 [Elusimicrobia bacterium]|nr:MAG: hypothetical protein A2016_00165 [Elusimicrobia bacterium GWF2_62_30]HBA59453.1 hypothetical protein [Elusimicrobiota bacterium]
MRSNHYAFIIAAALLCACAQPGRKGARPAAVPEKETAAPAAAGVKAPELSAEDSQKVEGLYYRAVGAYSNNDMAAALNYLNEISTLSPSYPPAVELRGKLKSVSGAKPAPPPQKP